MTSDQAFPGREKQQYTRRQKIETWFYYYKWWLLAGILLVLSLMPVFKNLLGIGVVRPDYQIACVTASGLSEHTAEHLTAALESMGEDLNGDGKVVVSLVQYKTGAGDRQTAMEYRYASTITIQADIARNASHFFLMDDPADFQRSYQVLADSDGRLPEDTDLSPAGRAVPWSSLGIRLDADADAELAGMYIGQRGYYDRSAVPHLDGCRRLWNKLTKEAVQ